MSRARTKSIFNLLQKILICLIDFYRWTISPFFPCCCRFYPSCSTYAKEALLHYGFLKGIQYIFLRVIKCHPFNPGGVDELIKK